MKIDSSIFKKYDIRGVYPKQLNEKLAYKISQSYSKILQGENPEKKLKIVVGYDVRLSSPSIKKEVINGLLDAGIEVIDIGLVSTPTFYFGVAYYGFDGGIQVSASHNPKAYNGLKMVRKNAVPISGEKGIYEMRDMVVGENWKNLSQRKGKVTTKRGVLEKLIDETTKDIDFSKIKSFKVVADASNATGALDLNAIFEKLPCELVRVNFELDGNFPSHQPDPLAPENLKLLREKVLEEGADLGLAPDGDADRLFIIDEKGNNLKQEILRGIMAQIALSEKPGATICYDIRPGKITKDMILQAGGKPIVTKVGHSLIKETMIENNAYFGGESSGHYFYQFPYGTFESPIRLLCLFLVHLSISEKTVSQLVKPYDIYFHSGEINSKVDSVTEKIEEITEKYKDAKLSTLDGVTVEYDDYWFNVRGSNTEPLLRLNLEAKTKGVMKKKRDEVIELIRS